MIWYARQRYAARYAANPVFMSAYLLRPAAKNKAESPNGHKPLRELALEKVKADSAVRDIAEQIAELGCQCLAPHPADFEAIAWVISVTDTAASFVVSCGKRWQAVQKILSGPSRFSL